MLKYSPAKLVSEEIIFSNLRKELLSTYISMEFSSSSNFSTNNIVVPTAGTVTIKVSENGVYWSSVENGTNIAVNTDDFTRPPVSGIVAAVKATPTGITGATHWRLLVGKE